MSEKPSNRKPSIIKFSGSTAAMIKRCQAQLIRKQSEEKSERIREEEVKESEE